MIIYPNAYMHKNAILGKTKAICRVNPSVFDD